MARNKTLGAKKQTIILYSLLEDDIDRDIYLAKNYIDIYIYAFNISS